MDATPIVVAIIATGPAYVTVLLNRRRSKDTNAKTTAIHEQVIPSNGTKLAEMIKNTDREVAALSAAHIRHLIEDHGKEL